MTGQGQLLRWLKTNKTWSCTALTFRGFHIRMYMHVRTHIYIAPLAGRVGLMVRRKLNWRPVFSSWVAQMCLCLWSLFGLCSALARGRRQGQRLLGGPRVLLPFWGHHALGCYKHSLSCQCSLPRFCNIPNTWHIVGAQYTLTMSEEGCVFLVLDAQGPGLHGPSGGRLHGFLQDAEAGRNGGCPSFGVWSPTGSQEGRWEEGTEEGPPT